MSLDNYCCLLDGFSSVQLNIPSRLRFNRFRDFSTQQNLHLFNQLLKAMLKKVIIIYVYVINPISGRVENIRKVAGGGH